MSFAIEVPGEASPLNPQELGRALQAANSNDHTQRQSAGQQLTAWEADPYYYPYLQSVFLDKFVPYDVRFLAIILLKNGIDKYWRHGAGKNAIKPEQKQLIRSRLLQGSVDEEDKSFILHNSLVVAKVVRIDYPQEWPDALSLIIGVVRTAKDGNQEQLVGALVVLLRVVKELGTARLRRSQTALQSVTPEIVQLLIEIYATKTAYWIDFLTKGRGDEDDADLAMQNTLTSLRILRRLLVVGYEYPHTNELVQSFWADSQQQFGQLLGYVSHDSAVPAPYQDVVGKHLIQLTKLHIDMSEAHPASFALLANSVPLVKAYWDLVANFAEVFDKSGGIKQTTAEGDGAKSKLEGPLLERLALKGLLLLKSCIAMVYQPMQTFRYRSLEVKKQQDEAVGLIKTELLVNDFVLNVVNVIITKLFIFRKSDLEAWEEDPEEWENQERNQGNAWEWEVRPCAERVFLDLLIHHKDLLQQPLLAYFDTATKTESDVVTKEAVYTAMGCAASSVYEVFDFDGFLATQIVRDAQLSDPLAKLLRRRIAILLSQWISVKTSPQSRPLVYEVFRHLMNPSDATNDEVVRITAARQLKWVADDFGFTGEDFLPFAADTFNVLISLLQEVSVEETKLAVLETVRIIVSRMDTHVAQFGDAIMTTLPKLWESEGTEEYMIKQAVLAITSALVMSMKGESQRYQNFVLPLLREALNPDSDLHLHLIEESVELWKSILQQSSQPVSQELVALVELALPLLEYDSQVSHDCLEIVKNYVLLAPEAMLSENLRRPTLVALVKAMDSRSRDKSSLGAKSIELLIQGAELVGGVQGVSVLVQDMLHTGFLLHVLEGLHDAWQSSQTTGPNRTERKVTTLVETDYLAILARISLVDPAIFSGALASLAGGNPEQLKSTWDWLSAEWFAAFDYMAGPDRQKLCCLGLTRLAELPPPFQELVLGRLQDYLSMWTAVVMELRTGDGAEAAGGTGVVEDTLVWGSQLPSFDYDTPLDVLERQLAAKDLVHSVNTFEFIGLRLQDLVRRTGGEQAFEADWAVNVDRDVLAGFQRLNQPAPQ